MNSRLYQQNRESIELQQLESALAFGLQLVEAVEVFALQFALPDLNIADLPAEEYDNADILTLQTVASLYLASELEAAQVLPTVELLSGLSRSGGLRLQHGNAAEQLFLFWKKRNQRFSPEERGAFFARLFGSETSGRLAMAESFNEPFQLLMIDLTEAISTVDTALAPGYQARAEVGLRIIAQRLAENLLQRGGGMANYAARDIIGVTQESLDILKQRDIQQTVGARSVWDLIQKVTQRYRQMDVDVRSHIQRGNAGMQLIAWVATILPKMRLDNNSPLLAGPNDPVLNAATVWLQSSLSIVEHELTSSGSLV